MEIKGVSAQDLEKAAHEVGVRLCDLRPAGSMGAWRFTLATDTERFGTGKAPYRRLAFNSYYSDGGRRTVPGRVCWHGFRDFFRAVFLRSPDAQIETSMATYRGSNDFERSYRKRTIWRGWINRGFAFAPKKYDPERAPCVCAAGHRV